MKFDFSTYIDRTGHDALATQGPFTFPGFTLDWVRDDFDFIPMWIADMNFATVPTVQEAMQARINHGVFGYFAPSDEYYNAIINWHETYNRVQGLKQEHIAYHNGVLGGLLSALGVICSKGDKVLLHSPTYVGFTMSMGNSGYEMIDSPLYLDENDIWRMDYEDMEAKIIEHQIHAAVFCSPHNPTGRVWEPEEIEKAMAIFEKHNVFVISDEIWSDFLLNGHQHTPTQSVSEYAKQHTVALYAPSKTFNLAGLIGAYHIIYNQWLRDRVAKEMSLSHYNEVNVLSMHALIGAYQPEGHQWLAELKEVLSENINTAYDYINEHFEGVSVSKPEGTYIMLINCEQWCQQHNKTLNELLKMGYEVGVGWQSGALFKAPYCIRLNLALPKAKMLEALDRLNQHVFK